MEQGEEENEFSWRFSSSTSSELRKVLESNDYTLAAKQAAIREFEERVINNYEPKSTLEKAKEILASQRVIEKYQTLPRRLVATLIDAVLVVPLYFLFTYLTSLGEQTLSIVTVISLPIYPYIYTVLLHGRYGQTLGKKLMSLKVVQATDESSVNYVQAFLRVLVPICIWLLGLISIVVGGVMVAVGQHVNNLGDLWVTLFGSILIGWYIVDWLCAVISKKSLALHDRISGCVVIKIKRSA